MAADSVNPSAARASSIPGFRRRILLAAGVVVFAALAAYHNCFNAPFVFDDLPAIADNPTIRHLWPLGEVLATPAGGSSARGRPLVNLSLALNYALGGEDVRGYHALNLALHILAALTLLGVVRRTLRFCSGQAQPGEDSLPLALAIALLWTVHPLLTESVTCVVNRTEVLAGLFYLLTLYCFVCGVDSPRPGRWYSLSVGACLLGMASKEIVLSAPLTVLLYDRTFVTGTFREAWRRHRRLYLGLAATWLLLVWLMLGTNHRNSTVGFGLGVSAWTYALTQCFAILRYLRLSFWPHPLVLDYGMYLVKSPMAVLPHALALGLLVAGTAAALWRWPAVGFLGAWFFVILAPSSSVVPLTTQTMAEHRMYLPLAVVVVLVVLGMHALTGRRSLAVWLALAIGLGFLTVRRNEDYRSESAIWSDTVAKWPDNARVHHRLGILLLGSGQVAEAIGQYRQALRIEPNNPDLLNALGHALFQAGRISEAIDCYEQTLRLKPDFAEVHNNLGIALMETGRVPEAIGHYEQALRFKSDYAEAHNNLGIALVQTGRVPEAIGHYEQALRLKSDYADAHLNLGNALVQRGSMAEAIGQYEQALRLKPDLAEAHSNLGYVLARLGRIQEAIGHYEELLRIDPADAEARNHLARLRAMQAVAGPGN